MIACCGIICTECPAFIATQKDDPREKTKVAQLWSKEFKADIKPEDINCDGCKSTSGQLFSHCNVCKIRSCAENKSIANCAYCKDFACRQLKFILDAVPNAKTTLGEIRKNI